MPCLEGFEEPGHGGVVGELLVRGFPAAGWEGVPCGASGGEGGVLGGDGLGGESIREGAAGGEGCGGEGRDGEDQGQTGHGFGGEDGMVRGA